MQGGEEVQQEAGARTMLGHRVDAEASSHCPDCRELGSRVLSKGWEGRSEHHEKIYSVEGLPWNSQSVSAITLQANNVSREHQ